MNLSLFALPVTSFRYFPFMGEGTYVRPLAFYPIALLLPLLLIQWMRGKKSMPRVGTLVPLVGFVLVVLVGSVFGSVLDPLPLRGQEYFGRVIRAWATLIIGLAFFISALWMNRDEDDLRFSVRWLFAGFIMDVLWSGVQSLAFYTTLLDKTQVTLWQRAFSMRELVRINRVSGMAFEPAWRAGQLMTVYLPWLFAALVTGYRVTKNKWFEVTLLGAALLLLLATYSRGGLLNVVLSVILTTLFVGREQIHVVWKWFVSGFKSGSGLLIRLSVIVIVIGALSGAVVFLGQKEYMARLFKSNANSIEEFIIENSAGARAAYTFGALGAYDENPWIGVGLGASGFYIYDNLPDWAYTFVPEIARQLSPDNRLYPNPKNMYARLLAETGVIGFFMFFAFLFSMLGDVLSPLKQNTPLARFIAMAGLFTWFAVLIYNATQDSFAIPNIWLNFGILIGVSAVVSSSETVSS